MAEIPFHTPEEQDNLSNQKYELTLANQEFLQTEFLHRV